MAFIEKNLGKQEVSNVIETIYTLIENKIAVKDINMCNTGGAECSISVYLVDNGDTASNENILISDFKIPPNSIRHWVGFQVVEGVGATIKAKSSINNQVTITISGAEL